MQTLLEANLKPRQRTRLRQAREKGYLDARHSDAANLLMAFSLWCWRLRLPVVWFERNSPRSRYGRVRLDLYTTANRLSDRGLMEMQSLTPAAVDISPHDARWSRVPRDQLEQLAARVIKAAVRAGNCEAAAPRLIQVPRRGPAEVIEMHRVQTTAS
jgi:hypothetical protein